MAMASAAASTRARRLGRGHSTAAETRRSGSSSREVERHARWRGFLSLLARMSPGRSLPRLTPSYRRRPGTARRAKSIETAVGPFAPRRLGRSVSLGRTVAATMRIDLAVSRHLTGELPVLARRALLIGWPLAMLATAASRAQAPPKVIGFLSPYGIVDAQATLQVFRQAMRELGYSEGKSFVLVERFADGRNERLPSLADELVKLGVDLILASTSNSVKAAQAATGSIPIVFESVGDPVAAGFAESVAHPGKNITGVSNFSIDLSPKRFQFLTQMVPSLNRVAVLTNVTNPYYRAQKPAIESVAERLGLSIRFVGAGTPEELEPAFRAIVANRAEALLVTADAYLYGQRQRIVELALKNGLPSMFPFAAYVEAGGLASYGVDPASGIRQAAAFVDRVFKGAKPGDLPIEQPTRVALMINRRTATRLHVTIPQALLLQAEKVID
jgi:putative ABC transport system substrate-binding protein